MSAASSENPRRRIAIIGGGVAGLAAAHRVTELQPDWEIALFEAGDRLGGALRTEREEGFLLEYGADNFISNIPWGIDLCRRLGISDQLIETNPGHRRALVVRGSQLFPVPEGFMLMEPRAVLPLLTTRLLSLGGKARMLAEFFVPARKTDGDESLASFARRRFGREAFERLVQPLVAGIYTADPEKLSLAATLPRFLEMEREHGGLIRAARKRRSHDSTDGSGARYSLFVTPCDGMQTLATALAAKLAPNSVRLSARVETMQPVATGGWNMQIAGDSSPFTCDGVILATPAPVTARLARPWDAELADALVGIPYAGSAIALVGYEEGQIERKIDAFGLVVPEVERRDVIAASFSSVKFPGRAPDGKSLVRVFLGGAMRPDLVTAADDQIREIVKRELGELIGARGEPCLFRVARWPSAMPQYHLGHLDRVARIAARVAVHSGLQTAGSAYAGVGVPHCIRSGEAAAAAVCQT
ncbi:MAG TPA: protoporphyrinogen oxidase [Pirellulales bacterium]|jgi:oxygen-dependent protoporphyrinogen oxidase